LPIAAWVASDAAGIRMGRVPDDERRRAAAELGLLFAFAIACEGLGSLYFHGSLTSWGAVLDSVGISAIGGVVLLSALLRGGVVKRRGVRWGLPGVVAAALAYRLFVLPVMAPFFLLLLVGIALGERRAIRSKAGVSTGPWFSRALAVFGLGVVVLLLSALPGFPLCRGDFVQAHALWHLLSAGASWCCWMHARSELILEGQPF
jgi:hypothetical protein